MCPHSTLPQHLEKQTHNTSKYLSEQVISYLRARPEYILFTVVIPEPREVPWKKERKEGRKQGKREAYFSLCSGLTQFTGYCGRLFQALVLDRVIFSYNWGTHWLADPTISKVLFLIHFLANPGHVSKCWPMGHAKNCTVGFLVRKFLLSWLGNTIFSLIFPLCFYWNVDLMARAAAAIL